MILVPDPYFNEPGYESTMLTPAGKEEGRKYNEQARTSVDRSGMSRGAVGITPSGKEGWVGVLRSGSSSPTVRGRWRAPPYLPSSHFHTTARCAP